VAAKNLSELELKALNYLRISQPHFANRFQLAHYLKISFDEVADLISNLTDDGLVTIRVIGRLACIQPTEPALQLIKIHSGLRNERERTQ